MAKKIRDKERDSIDFGKSKIDPLFNSIFYPTLLSMVFASLFTVADGIFVGQGVGSNALAAINIVSPLFLITTGIALWASRLGQVSICRKTTTKPLTSISHKPSMWLRC